MTYTQKTINDQKPIHIVGAGLAGSECAWGLAEAGATVIIHEMRPGQETFAHKTGLCAELVCSNSFRSDDWANNAVGLIHEEMRRCGSLIMGMADMHRLPAGGALAVDRDAFAEAVTAKLSAHPNISFQYGEVSALPAANDGQWIFATGPLTSTALSQSILAKTGEESLAFFDAIAPIIYKDSINMDVAWYQSRWDKSSGPDGQNGGDYINCPMNKEEYERFYDALMAAEVTNFKEWEGTPYFEACLPVEVMASRGKDTLRFGPMKPVGLTDPRTGRRPWAVVQLRQDNQLGTLFNMVGFQTKMKYGAQTEVLRLIPGLENAEFARLGGIHRNIFIHSPRLLDDVLRLKAQPNIRFAGQITGCEGYVESAALGLLAARFAVSELAGEKAVPPPNTTALGAILNHVTGGHIDDGAAAGKGSFQPMNVNFGLFPPLNEDAGGKGKMRTKLRKQALAIRALTELNPWLGQDLPLPLLPSAAAEAAET